MGFCTKCGAFIKDDDIFCGKCGARRTTEANNVVVQPISQSFEMKSSEYVAPAQSQSTGPSSRSIVALVMAILLGPIGLLLGISEYSKKDGRSKGLAIASIIVGVVDTIVIIIMMIITIPKISKSVEVKNVKSDVLLCDIIKTAIVTATMDPSVIGSDNANFPTNLNYYASFNSTNCGNGAFQEAVEEILGFSVDDAEEQIKSHYNGQKAGGIEFKFDFHGEVSVRIRNSDRTGNKGKNGVNPIEVDRSYSRW